MVNFNVVRVSSLAFAALLASSAVQAEKGNVEEIQFYAPSTRVEFISLLARNVEKLARDNHVLYHFFEADNSAKTQLEILNTNNKPNISYVIRSCDGLEHQKLIDVVKKNKATMVFLPNEIPQKVIDYYDNAWQVSKDNLEEGAALAAAVISYVKAHPECDKNKNGSIETFIVHGPKKHIAEIARNKKVKEYFSKVKIDFNIVDEVYADWYFEQAYSAIEKTFDDESFNDIELIVSMNDAMALGCIDAIEQHSYETGKNIAIPPIFGVDALRSALVMIKDGKMTATINTDAGKIAEIAYNIAMGVHDFGELSKIAGFPIDSRKITVKPMVYTKKNLPDVF